MQLKDLYYNLSHGVLSNLSMCQEEYVGTVSPAGKPKIVVAANDALLRLYSRFVLKEKDVLIETYEHITNYHFLARFAESKFPDAGMPYPYIKDLHAEPFKEDVIRVLEVYDNRGRKYPLNDENNPWSLFTPQVNMLQVPHPQNGESLAVMYQCKHDRLVGTDDEEVIELPDSLEHAFYAFIAYRIYSQMNTGESTAKAQEHMAMYETICLEVEEKDLVQTSTSPTNTRFHKRGWK